jgi:transglutaminase-like putative cysteine protease
MTLTHTGGQRGSAPPIKDLAPYLARNSFLDTSDPVLKKLATEGAGEATSPMAMAHNLRKFVADYITKKDLSVGFATASETAQSHEGDCTEHAVLLAALGRIRHVPTRVVAGLVYLPEYEGQNNILGFHMWTQFYISNQWVDYDSAVTDGLHPYWRLGFVATDLNDVSLSDFSMELMSWMAEMKISVESITPAVAAGN